MDNMGKNYESSKDALKTLYYVIIGFAITEALSRTFLINSSFIGRRIFDLGRLPCTMLLLSFMPTICRFVHGATIHLDMFTEESNKPFCDFMGFFLQALFFYMMAITLEKPSWFLLFFLLMLIFDALWLVILKKMKYISFNSTEKQWLRSDVVLSVVFIILLFYFYPKGSPVFLAILILMASSTAAFFDYYKNWEFYFPKH